MSKHLLVGAGLAIAAAVIVILWQLRGGGSKVQPGAREPGAAAKNPPPAFRPESALHPDPDIGGPKTAGPEFQKIRTAAVLRFQGDVMQRMQTCIPPQNATPPQPRDVRFLFEWRPDHSTPELQHLLVREVKILDVGGIAPAARDCLEHTLGMQLALPLPPDQLPLDSRTFDQVIQVAVP